MTAWTDLVKKVWESNKHKAGYKFKDALKDAKKEYKGDKNKTKKTKGGLFNLFSKKDTNSGGVPTVQQDNSVVSNTIPQGGDSTQPLISGGKKSKTKKNKSRKDKKKGGANIETTGKTPYFGTKGGSKFVGEMLPK